MENTNMNSVNAPRQSGSRALIWSIVIIILVIIGGMYAYGRNKDARMNDESNLPADNDSSYGGPVNTSTSVDQSSQSDSDDLDSIDKDLNDTDVNSLDEGM